MAKVVRWEVAGSGLLQLLDGDGSILIRAAPTDVED
jgi:hypothetical protein